MLLTSRRRRRRRRRRGGDISVDSYRLWFGEDPKILVRLQEKIMGLESCNTRATATLSTRRPFNDNAAGNACQRGAISILMKHGWVPQEKIMGLAGVMFACLTENTPPLKRGRSARVSVACHCGIFSWEVVSPIIFSCRRTREKGPWIYLSRYLAHHED